MDTTLTQKYDKALMKSLVGTRINFHAHQEFLVKDFVHNHLYLVREKDGWETMLKCEHAENQYKEWMKKQENKKDPPVKQFFKKYGIIYNGTKRDFEIHDGGTYGDGMLSGTHINHRQLESFCYHSAFTNTPGEYWQTTLKAQGRGFGFYHTFEVDPSDPIGFKMGQSIIRVMEKQQMVSDKELEKIKNDNPEWYKKIISGEYMKDHTTITNLKHEDIVTKAREALEVVWKEDVLPYVGKNLMYTEKEKSTWDTPAKKYKSGHFYTLGKPFAFTFDGPFIEESWDKCEVHITRCNIFGNNRIKPQSSGTEALAKGKPITLDKFKKTIIDPLFDKLVHYMTRNTYEQIENSFYKK